MGKTNISNKSWQISFQWPLPLILPDSISLFTKCVELWASAFLFNSSRLLPRNMSFLQSLLNCSWFVTKLPKKLPSSKKKASQPWTGYLVIFLAGERRTAAKSAATWNSLWLMCLIRPGPAGNYLSLGKAAKVHFSFQESFLLKIRNHFCAQLCEIFQLVYRKGNWVFLCVGKFQSFHISQKGVGHLSCFTSWIAFKKMDFNTCEL